MQFPGDLVCLLCRFPGQEFQENPFAIEKDRDYDNRIRWYGGISYASAQRELVRQDYGNSGDGIWIFRGPVAEGTALFRAYYLLHARFIT